MADNLEIKAFNDLDEIRKDAKHALELLENGNIEQAEARLEDIHERAEVWRDA